MHDFSFLSILCNCCAPSSHEMDVQHCLATAFADSNVSCSGDALGNLYATLNASAPFRVALVAHADEVGMQVVGYTDDGHLLFRKIGGVRSTSLAGQLVRCLVSEAGPIAGVIGFDPLQDNGTGNGLLLKTSDLWIDIGAENRVEAEALVPVGTYVTFESDFRSLGSHRLASKSLDNRLGAYVMYASMIRLAALPLTIGLTGISTVQEEIVPRGLSIFSPIPYAVALVLDVDFATDIPGDTSCGSNLRLGGGVGVPLNADSSPVLLHILREVAACQGIPLQCFPSRNFTGGTDALQLKSGGSVAVLNLSIPLRYMHSRYEVCDVCDVLRAIDLVCALVTHFNNCPTQNLVPWQNNF